MAMLMIAFGVWDIRWFGILVAAWLAFQNLRFHDLQSFEDRGPVGLQDHPRAIGGTRGVVSEMFKLRRRQRRGELAVPPSVRLFKSQDYPGSSRWISTPRRRKASIPS